MPASLAMQAAHSSSSQPVSALGGTRKRGMHVQVTVSRQEAEHNQALALPGTVEVLAVLLLLPNMLRQTNLRQTLNRPQQPPLM